MIKKITFMGLLLLLSSFSVTAQLVEDFEAGATTPVAQFNLTNQIVANPNKTGINTTDNCLQMTRTTGTNFWALSRVNIADQTISASDTKYLTMMVRSSVVTRFHVRFDASSDTNNGSNPGIIESLNVYDGNNLNEWQQLVFEIRSVNGGAHTFTSNSGTLFNLILHPDGSGGISGIPNEGVVLNASTPIFVDQLTITDTNPLANTSKVVENFESTVDATGQFDMTNTVVANPNASGINTSANCLRVIRTGSNLNWYALSRVNITDERTTRSAKKFLSVMVRSSVATEFSVRFDADSDTGIGTNPGVIHSLNAYDANNLNEWQQLIFEVRSLRTGEHTFTSNFGTVFNLILHPDSGGGANAGVDLDTSTPIFVDNLTMSFTNPLANDWLGGTSTNWATGSNWSKGTVPTSTDIVTIPSGTTFAPTINTTTGASVGSLTIDSGAVVTVENGGSLKVAGTSSGAQGSIKYTRTLTADASPTKAWHLITSPIAGQTVANFMTSNTLASGTTNTNFRGIGNYTNNGNGFNYYEFGYAGTDAFNAGQGFAVKNAAAGTVEFSGFFRKSDKEFSISQGTDNFNLVGNAFLAYMNLGTFFTNNNATDRLTEATIWLWDPSANSGNGGYITKMSGTDSAFEIAPGQAFFVSAGSAASNVVSFSEANQSHKTDSFLKSSANRTEIKLNVKQGSLEENTSLYYIQGTSTGFDNGFDGSLFTGTSSDLVIYTELVTDNVGRKMSIQSLPNAENNDFIIPVGLNANAGNITISAVSLNLPKGINVILEDRENGSFTNLNTSDYKTTLNEAVNGSGRFFLRTSTNGILSTDVSELSGVNMYKSGYRSLKITGLNSNGSISIFNILGKQVMTQKITANTNLDIALPSLTSGVYIVKLDTNDGSLNKKIILE